MFEIRNLASRVATEEELYNAIYALCVTPFAVMLPETNRYISRRRQSDELEKQDGKVDCMI